MIGISSDWHLGWPASIKTSKFGGRAVWALYGFDCVEDSDSESWIRFDLTKWIFRDLTWRIYVVPNAWNDTTFYEWMIMDPPNWFLLSSIRWQYCSAHQFFQSSLLTNVVFSTFVQYVSEILSNSSWLDYVWFFMFNRTIFYTCMRTNMTIEWISSEKYCQK